MINCTTSVVCINAFGVILRYKIHCFSAIREMIRG